MMQPECPTDRKKRWVFPIGQQYPRPLDPACRFRLRFSTSPYPYLQATIQSHAATPP
jgi:hypothetical protein